MRITSVAPGIYRGPRPENGDDWQSLTDLGIVSVLNLEGGIIEALTRDSNLQQMFSVYRGIETIRLEMNALFPPDHQDVARAIEVIQRSKKCPIYVHCREGVDRTGFVIAVYRMVVCGWRYRDAVNEMLDLGFHCWYWYWLPSLRKFQGANL